MQRGSLSGDKPINYTSHSQRMSNAQKCCPYLFDLNEILRSGLVQTIVVMTFPTYNAKGTAVVKKKAVSGMNFCGTFDTAFFLRYFFVTKTTQKHEIT
jgi:hypothetical protein